MSDSIKSSSASLLNALVDMQASPAYAVRKEVLMQAESAIVSLEKQRDELIYLLEDVIEYVEKPPTENCSCHISPPCGDCVDFSHLREVLRSAEIEIKKAKAS